MPRKPQQVPGEKLGLRPAGRQRRRRGRLQRVPPSWLLPSLLSTARHGWTTPLMSLTYGTTELCGSPLSPSHNSHGGRFYNPHRSSRSLRSAPGGPEHAPLSAPTAQTLPERGEMVLAAPRQHHPLHRAQRGSQGQVPTTPPACPAILPQGQHRHLRPFPSRSPPAPQLCPAFSTSHPSTQRSAKTTRSSTAKPQPGTDKTHIRKGLTSSRFSNILEPEPSGKHLHRGERI